MTFMRAPEFDDIPCCSLDLLAHVADQLKWLLEAKRVTSSRVMTTVWMILWGLVLLSNLRVRSTLME